ncbi:MAG: hypothetical protein AAF674_04560 [Pseudomonadota bacterium]
MSYVPDFQQFQSNTDLRALSEQLSLAEGDVTAITAPEQPDWVRVEMLAAEPDSSDFAPATAWLIRNVLAGKGDPQGLQWNWDCFEEAYAALRPDIRSILAVGFRRAGVDAPHAWRSSLDTESIRRGLRALAQEMTLAEREAIAKSDGHGRWQDHVAALVKVIDGQNCHMNKEQYWYPHEAVSLAAYGPSCRPEFLGATALLLIDELPAPDVVSTWKWSLLANEYSQLEEPGRSAILAAFRHCYEHNDQWDPDFAHLRKKDGKRPMVAVPPAAPAFLKGPRDA